MQLLIDADLIVMRFACRHETKWDFPENEHSTPDDPDFITQEVEEAESGARMFIRALQTRTQAEEVLLCFTGKENWRKQVFQTYKHNRAGRWVPALREHLTSFLMSEFPSLRVAQLEADDLLGILQTEKNAQDTATIIASIDKDLMQIPGWHYNWNQDDKPVFVDELGGAYLHMFQTLIGDATDGYPGCPKIGPKKAAEILPRDVLADQLETWSRIVTAYEQAGQTEEEAIANARMARILRCGEYEHQPKRKVKLWLPFDQEEWKEF